jgi:hypothetical protein
MDLRGDLRDPPLYPGLGDCPNNLSSPSPEYSGTYQYIRGHSSGGLFIGTLRRVRTPRQPYSPKLVEVEFCELRLYGVLGSWLRGSTDGIMLVVEDLGPLLEELQYR